MILSIIKNNNFEILYFYSLRILILIVVIIDFLKYV
jgi:hypothetical protein